MGTFEKSCHTPAVAKNRYRGAGGRGGGEARGGVTYQSGGDGGHGVLFRKLSPLDDPLEQFPAGGDLENEVVLVLAGK